MGHARRRRGLGIVAILAIGVALWVGISILSSGGRGLWFTDDGFLGRPRAPASAEVAAPAPAAPTTSTDLSALRADVDRAHEALTAALQAGDPAAIATRREALARAQAALAAARSAAP